MGERARDSALGTRRLGSVGALTTELTEVLARANVAEAKAEARDIVAAVMDVPRFWPSLHAGEAAEAAVVMAARAAAAKRAGGAPFAYAVGRAAFRHLTLAVDERVLIPRQETEVLVDAVLAAPLAPGGTAVDVGTGSGAIALALAAEGRFARVVATDVSLGALAVAGANVERLRAVLRAPVQLRGGADLAPVAGERVRAVVANPPYIAPDEARELPAGVRDWEPPIALFSGRGGLAATARIVAAAPAVLEPDGLLALELDSRRAAATAAMVRADGRYRDVELRRDLAGRDRILIAYRTDT